MDTKPFKATNSEGGTITAQLAVAEVTTLHLTPVPDKAPGTLTINAGNAKEEEIFYKAKDANAGTVTGLTRDYSNLNGGTGQQHENGDSWETLQSVTPLNNLVDAVIEGYIEEMQTVTYVSATTFTVATDRTGYYTAGRMIRINQNGSLIGSVVSSSYSAGTGLTTVITVGVTVPNPTTRVELEVSPKGATELSAKPTSAIRLTGQASAPANPATGQYKIYVDSDGNPKLVDSTGTVSTLGGGGASFWSVIPAVATRISDTQFTMPDTANALSLNKLFCKGTILRWLEGADDRFAMVTSSTYAANVVTVNIVGNFLDAGFTVMKYCLQLALKNYGESDFIITPYPSAAVTNVSKTIVLPEECLALAVDFRLTGAGAGTGSTITDVNANGTTIITTKPTITTTGTSDLGKATNLLTANTITALAKDTAITVDNDSTTSTAPVGDGLVTLWVMPTSWRYR